MTKPDKFENVGGREHRDHGQEWSDSQGTIRCQCGIKFTASDRLIGAESPATAPTDAY